jgi:hypothetical protein
MFGMKRRMRALPWPTRVVVGTLMFLVCSWGAMRLGVSVWMDGLNEVSDENDFEYDSSFFSMNGDFGARDVRITHYLPDGNVGMVLLADRMVVHTPGLHWLWWATFRSTRNVPDQLGVTLENVRDAARTAQTPGNYSNLPYDAMGCGKDMLTPENLRAMGLPEPRRDVSAWLRRKEGDHSTLGMEMLTHGMGRFSLDLDVSIERPIKWRETLVHLNEAKLLGATMKIRDLGFVPARNAYCGKAAGLAPAAFQAYQQRATSEFLRKTRVAYDAQTLARLQQFSRDGGELVIAVRHPPAMDLPKLAENDSWSTLARMPATISYNGGPEAPLHMDRVLPGEISQATPPPATTTAGSSGAVAAGVEATAAAPAATPAPVASNSPALAQATSSAAAAERLAAARPAAAAVATAAPSAGPSSGVLAYADLKSRVGAHIEIVTNSGTTRRGTLLAHSLYLSTMRLDADQGGFTLSIPADTVVEVRAIPLPASPAAGAIAATPGAPRS